LLSGVIDIKDYQFTDQRFVLAGITLLQKFGKYTLSDLFWNTYQQYVEVDNTCYQFEPLFQIYYLLVWIKVHPHGSVEQKRMY
jgi:fructosamine-3-kinase